MMTFASLGVKPPILGALEACGYAAPTLIQEKAIPAGLAGRDVLGCAQTGTGKTCAFGVPILQRLAGRRGTGRIRALILTPTRELAIQNDENLRAYGAGLPLKEAVIFGGVGQTPQVELLQSGVDILTATPGRLLDLQGQGLLDLSGVEIFVLDEADRMLDMGFIHDVRRVIRLLPAKKQTMFFTATMPPEIMELVDTLLREPVRVEAAPVSTPVELIDQKVYLIERARKTELLIKLLREQDVRSALVFTRTKHGADKVARDLNRKGVSAAAIHGNKSQSARQDSLRRFKGGQVRVLVATDIAARGLDIEELGHVFNYNLPEVPETYIHRIGRTGRAGRGGVAIAFCDEAEQPLLKDIEKLLKKPVPRGEADLPPKEVPEENAQPAPVPAPVPAEPEKPARSRRAEKRAKAERAEKPSQQPAAPKASRAKKQEPKPAPKAAAPAPAPAPVKKERRPMPHGKQNLRSLEEYLAAPSDILPETSHAVDFRQALQGERIMDATARLLAPSTTFRFRESARPARNERRDRREESPRREKKQEEKRESRAERRRVEKEPEQNRAPEKENRRENRAERRHGGEKPQENRFGSRNAQSETARPARRGTVRKIPRQSEPPRTQTKDSTEQRSLMKPFYIDHD